MENVPLCEWSNEYNQIELTYALYFFEHHLLTIVQFFVEFKANQELDRCTMRETMLTNVGIGARTTNPFAIEQHRLADHRVDLSVGPADRFGTQTNPFMVSPLIDAWARDEAHF